MPLTTTPTRQVGGRTVPAAGTWIVDASHSSVEFVARHLVVTKVRGRFTDWSAELVIGERPEELPSLVGAAGDQEVHAHRSTLERMQDAAGRGQDPRRLVGVRVDHHRRQVEHGEPLREGAGVSVQGGEQEVARGIGRHQPETVARRR